MNTLLELLRFQFAIYVQYLKVGFSSSSCK